MSRTVPGKPAAVRILQPVAGGAVLQHEPPLIDGVPERLAQRVGDRDPAWASYSLPVQPSRRRPECWLGEMNSIYAGLPDVLTSSARRRAGMTSAGSLTRSVWKPRAPITFDISTSSGLMYLVREGIVSRPPEARSVTGKAAIADVHDRDPELFAQQYLKVAEHVTKSRLAGHRHGCPLLGKRLLGGNGGGQAEAEGRNIAPTPRKPRADQSVEDGAEAWSRVLPDSCVTNELCKSKTCMRSPYTRYGLIGVSSEFMTCRYRASPSSRAAFTSAATLPVLPPAPEARPDTSWRSACRVSRASPITAAAVGYILLMCNSSTLQWMMVFFVGSGMPWLKRPGDRLDPMARMTSLLFR